MATPVPFEITDPYPSCHSLAKSSKKFSHHTISKFLHRNDRYYPKSIPDFKVKIDNSESSSRQNWKSKSSSIFGRKYQSTFLKLGIKVLSSKTKLCIWSNVEVRFISRWWRGLKTRALWNTRKVSQFVQQPKSLLEWLKLLENNLYTFRRESCVMVSPRALF